MPHGFEGPSFASLCVSVFPLAAYYWSSLLEYEKERHTDSHYLVHYVNYWSLFVCNGLFYHWSVFDWFEYNFISLVLVFCIYMYPQPNWSIALLLSIHSAWCEIKQKNTLVKNKIFFFIPPDGWEYSFGCCGSHCYWLLAIGGDRVHNMSLSLHSTYSMYCTETLLYHQINLHIWCVVQLLPKL